MTLTNPLRVMLDASGANMRSNGNLLRLADEVEGSKARWVQVALEGEFLGYTLPNGKKGFKFTRQIFDEVVHNVKSHPSFSAGANGVGTQGIVPWDFDHVSASNPAGGMRPITGAPSQGWSSDAEVRMGTNGKSELWMLTEFQEPARGYVKDGKYKWASVVLAFSSIDKVTGQPKGAVVQSVALTNTPFLEGMQQLVAASATTPGATASGHPAAQAEEIHRMEILAMLASILGTAADQDSITRRIESLVKLHDGLVAMFEIEPSRATCSALLQASADANEGHVNLTALIAALSSKNHGEAVTRVTELVAASATLAEIQPKMVILEAAHKAAEEVEVKLDVDRAIASNPAYTDALRPMFTLSRTTDKDAFLAQFPVDAAPAAPGVVLSPAQMAALQTNVAATPAGTQLAVPTTAPAAPAAGPQFSLGANGQVMVAPGAAAAVAPATGALNGAVVNLALYPGANDPQRMVAHLSQTRPGFKEMDWDDQFESAMLALNALNGASA